MPASNALAYRNGLKFEPGWRFAWVARLNLDSSKPIPPTRARMAPCLGSNDTSADCALGTCASRHPSPVSRTRIRSPGANSAAGVFSGGAVWFTDRYCRTLSRSPSHARAIASPDLSSTDTASLPTAVTMPGGSLAMVGMSPSAACQRARVSSDDSPSRGARRRSGPRQPCRQS